MSYTLRGYQAEASARALAYLTDPKMRGRNGITIEPTGAGKSLIIADIATKLDGPCVVFQPRKEILVQNMQKLQAYGYRPSVFSASLGRREVGKITLATIGTLIKNIDAFEAFRYVIVDECHEVNPAGGRYAEFLGVMDEREDGRGLKRPSERVRTIGFTATPYRLSSSMMGTMLKFLTRTRPRIFRDVIHETPIQHLVTDGFWVPLEYRERPILRRDKLKVNTTGADYTDASVQLELAACGFAGKVADEVMALFAEGLQSVLTFTRFTSEADQIAKLVPGSAVVTAETPAGERERILVDFKLGRIRHVANVGIISIGFDFPELQGVVLARPSISLSLYYQQVGRAVRPVYGPGDTSTREGRFAAMAAGPKPKAIVVDMVGLVKEFGKVEEINLRPGPRNRDLWTIHSGERQLTNIYFHERDGVNAVEAAKAQKRRQFWGRRALGG